MPTTPRIGLWFGQGIDNALAARAALGQLQAQYPGADWVLLGPQSSFFLFEMDPRVPAYIPLLALEPRRAAQTWFMYFLEKRTQFKKLRALQFHKCIGVSVVLPDAQSNHQIQQQFLHLQKILRADGSFIQDKLMVFLAHSHPPLQAGPQALAFATHYHRKLAPKTTKLLVLLVDLDEQGRPPLQQWLALQASVVAFQPAHVTVGVIMGSGNRLLLRQIGETHPEWQLLNMPQAIGFVAYADRVITLSSMVTRICQEMGRSEQLLLAKTNS